MRLRFNFLSLILFISAAAIVFAFTFLDPKRGTEWNRKLLKYREPVVPYDYRGKVTILWHDEQEVVSGPRKYSEGHWSGWRACLNYFHEESPLWNDREFWEEYSQTIQLPPQEVVPVGAGYRACLRDLELLLDKMPEHDLRKRLAVREAAVTSTEISIVVATVLWLLALSWSLFWRRERQFQGKVDELG